MLLFALVGGAVLHHARQAQASRDAFAGQFNAADPNQLALMQAAQRAANAPQVAAQQRAQVSAEHSANAAAVAAAAAAHKAEEAARASHGSSASRSTPRTPDVGPIPSSCSAYTGNRALGCKLVLDAGLSLTQMACLDKMWTKESNWRTTAENSSSGAYGIPQALPASKMATYGSDYRTNPTPQIKWGLAYIKGRYGTPCDAWSFWQAHGWY
ncbi:MAG TPA: lytic transglycosylase domain-containing protein [Micromonosporaceae bacterium]|nr:lytic transglycosylase domain-containing protein [Micromonosporaceae bacterium]